VRPDAGFFFVAHFAKNSEPIKTEFFERLAGCKIRRNSGFRLFHPDIYSKRRLKNSEFCLKKPDFSVKNSNFGQRLRFLAKNSDILGLKSGPPKKGLSVGNWYCLISCFQMALYIT